MVRNVGKTFKDRRDECKKHRGKRKLREIARHGDEAKQSDEHKR